MSSVSVSRTIKIYLDAEEKELLEKAIVKGKELANQFKEEGIFMTKESVFKCLLWDFDSNSGKLSGYIDLKG